MSIKFKVLLLSIIGPTLLAVGLNLYRHWLELDENASEPPASIPTPPNN